MAKKTLEITLTKLKPATMKERRKTAMVEKKAPIEKKIIVASSKSVGKSKKSKKGGYMA